MTMSSISNITPNSSTQKTGAMIGIGLASITRQPTHNQPFHHSAKLESLQNSEAGEGEDTREGLMLEEDDDDTIYNDGLEQ
jgi:hypothetical protein